MKIKQIDVFQKTYTMSAGKFVISGGKVASDQDSTIVRIETDNGLVGWGEQCVFSPGYLVAHGDGARAALKLLAPAVLGMDPSTPVINSSNSFCAGAHWEKNPRTRKMPAIRGRIENKVK